jgi:hypothetical protein
MDSWSGGLSQRLRTGDHAAALLLASRHPRILSGSSVASLNSQEMTMRLAFIAA